MVENHSLKVLWMLKGTLYIFKGNLRPNIFSKGHGVLIEDKDGT